jgi:hypothetical protein
MRRGLENLLREAGLAPLRISYQNFFTFIPTLFVRLWQGRTQRVPRYDMSQPAPLINSLLGWLLRLEAWLIRYVELPIGVDLVAVCRPEKGR